MQIRYIVFCIIWIVRVACSKMPILAHLLRWWISQGFSDFPRKHWRDPRYMFISQGEKSLDKAAVSGHWQRSWWARKMEQAPHECDLSLQITSWPLFPGHSVSSVGREDMVKCKSFHYYFIGQENLSFAHLALIIWQFPDWSSTRSLRSGMVEPDSSIGQDAEPWAFCWEETL